MEKLKWPDDEPIEAKMVSRAIENAQKQIEELNFERRKNVLKYDDVMNTQRTGDLRASARRSSRAATSRTQALEMVEETVGNTVGHPVPAGRVPRGLGPRRAVHDAAGRSTPCR